MWLQLDPQIYRALVAYSRSQLYFCFSLLCHRNRRAITTLLSLS